MSGTPAAAPTVPGLRFTLPAGREADAPPERRGLARDGVRLLVARPSGVAHHRFGDLPEQLDAGDLLVINTSATLPAALPARRADGRDALLHVATPLDDGAWVVELRSADGARPDPTARPGERLGLPDGVALELERPYPGARAPRPRLWRAEVRPRTPLVGYLRRHGRPIGYGYLSEAFTLAERQNVYAQEAGSAEMPSAGRPLTERLITRLVARGVALAPVLLHTGVSSPERHEPPQPERFRVPRATARLVDATRAGGGRVVAVGTSVVRALESARGPDGGVRAASGWTDLVLDAARPARIVDALVSGLHPPEASHLALLEAIAGGTLIERAYREALAGPYLWHEFGDSMLFIGNRPGQDTNARAPAGNRAGPRPRARASADGPRACGRS